MQFTRFQLSGKAQPLPNVERIDRIADEGERYRIDLFCRVCINGGLKGNYITVLPYTIVPLYYSTDQKKFQVYFERFIRALYAYYTLCVYVFLLFVCRRR